MCASMLPNSVQSSQKPHLGGKRAMSVLTDGSSRPKIPKIPPDCLLPSNGFFYVLDRRTGKLLSAKNFTVVSWASGIDLKTRRPIGILARRWSIPPGPAATFGHRCLSTRALGLSIFPRLTWPVVGSTCCKRWMHQIHRQFLYHNRHLSR